MQYVLKSELLAGIELQRAIGGTLYVSTCVNCGLKMEKNISIELEQRI